MSRIKKMLLISGIVLLVLIVVPAALFKWSQTKSEASRLKEGDRAPDFSLTDQNGNTVRLADYRGKKTLVLAFYIKAGTPG
jgi:cytochrome oxidase Cu insertion factor (SCO1/SenC/PrrC family)